MVRILVGAIIVFVALGLFYGWSLYSPWIKDLLIKMFKRS